MRSITILLIALLWTVLCLMALAIYLNDSLLTLPIFLLSGASVFLVTLACWKDDLFLRNSRLGDRALEEPRTQQDGATMDLGGNEGTVIMLHPGGPAVAPWQSIDTYPFYDHWDENGTWHPGREGPLADLLYADGTVILSAQWRYHEKTTNGARHGFWGIGAAAGVPYRVPQYWRPAQKRRLR